MQSNKDSSGGKTHPSKSGSNGQAGSAKEKKKNAGSPTGSQTKGEKKTTP